jgi:pentatricopeptide repeat protein
MQNSNRLHLTVIKAYSKIGNPEKADELLHELQDISKQSFHKKGVHKLPADVMTIGACIDAWSKMGNEDIDRAIERAEHHLQQIVNKYRDGLVGPYEKHVDSWVFETVIRLWAGSRKPESAERIMSLIDQMEELNKVAPGLFRPTTNAFVLALDAWAISGREDGGKKAMVVIRKMRKLHEEGKLDEPNIRALSSALASVTRASGRGVISSAEDLYRQILELFKRGDRSAPVNSRTLTSLLTTLLYKSNETDAHVRALRVLRQTIDLGRDDLSLLAPNTIVFNCVLNGLAKRHVSDESWELFQEMKVLESEGYDCSPDVVTYSCVGRAIASGRIPSSSDKLSDRLAQLQSEILQRYEEGSLKPDIQLFNTIIIGYSNLSKFEPTAAKKANDVLAWLESLTEGDLTPDLLTYSSICHANAMSKTIGTTRIAEETLLRAQSLAAEGRITALNSDIYSSVALAHTRSHEEGSLEKAGYFIDQMEVLRKEGHPKVKAQTQIFNTLLSAHASSRDPDKVAKAVSTFNNMNDIFVEGQKECEPDVHSFNWVSLSFCSIPVFCTKACLPFFCSIHLDYLGRSAHL